MDDRFKRYKKLRLDRPLDRVMRITLDRPERLNALDREAHSEIAEIWRDIDADPTISVALLTGAGRAFSAGGDLEMAEELTRDFDTRVAVWKESRALVYNVLECSKPIVSAMRGPAVGAGLVAALLADVSIAARDARIIDGHTRLGVAAGDHAALIWPLLCGMAKAKYHLLLCEPMSGVEAERLGLISLAVDDDELEPKALEIAQRLADGPQNAIRWTKHALNNWMRSAGPIFDASLALEFLGFTDPDAREGIAALKEKRPPEFGRKRKP
jgi:enoyl-CoA hydratase/carnithine racemase